MKRAAVLTLALALAACAKPVDRPKTASVGAPAPELGLTEIVRGDLKTPVKWADLAGKAVVLEFWGTGCEPCVDNIPHLNDLAAKFKDKPVVFLSAAIDSRGAVEEFLKTHEMAGVIAAGTPQQLFRDFKGHGIPHTVLVDRKGVVAGFTYPSMVTEKTIDALLEGKPVAGDGAAPEAEAPADASNSLAFFSVEEPGGAPSLRYSDDEFLADAMALSNIIETAMRGTHGVRYADLSPDTLKSKFKVSARVARVAGADNAPRLRDLFVSGMNAALPLRISVVRRDMKVYLLKKDGALKPGLALSANKSGGRKTSHGAHEASVEAEAGDMGTLASELEEWIGAPVLDETGLAARYDYKLAVKDLSPKAVSAALARDLGLKLVEGRREVEITEVKGVKARKL